MKKVIFICLLSLSICLGKPTDSAAPVNPQPAAAQDPKTAVVTLSPDHADPNTKASNAAGQTEPKSSAGAPGGAVSTPINTPAANAQTPPAGDKPGANPTQTTATGTATEPNSIAKNTAGTENKIDTPKGKVDKETSDTSKSGTAPASGNKAATDPASGAKTADNKDANTSGAKPEENDKKDGTTPKADVTPKSTEKPKDASEPHVVQARGFDGPSFIGGIILTLGLLAIGFMGFKYYKNQTERNYHTL